MFFTDTIILYRVQDNLAIAIINKKYRGIFD